MYNLYVLVFSNSINWNKKIITYPQWAFIYDIKGIYVYYDAHSGVQITCQIYPYKHGNISNNNAEVK